jgi:ribulose-phosphate 3-epimerase
MADTGRRDWKLKRIIEIAPSILAADFMRLGREIMDVEHAGAGLIHLDVMDGHFVPNITFGPPVVASIGKDTLLPLDVHLMIENPARYLDDFIGAGARMLSVHVEADAHLDRTLNYIRSRGVRPGIAVNPGTPLGLLEEVLHLADFVLLMTVNPGFGGQAFIPSSLKKIKKLKQLIASENLPCRIEVDGGIGPDNLGDVLKAGAEIIVAGSAVFRSPKGPARAFREMNRIAERHSQSLEKGRTAP